MNKNACLSRALVSTLAASLVLLLAAILCKPVQAAPAQGYTLSTTAPVQLAWYYGPGRGYYYRHYWGPVRVNHCRRVCWRNYWGSLRCAIRC